MNSERQITFDPTKEAANQEKYGVSLALLGAVLDGETATFPDDRRDYGEARFISFGYVEGRLMPQPGRCAMAPTGRPASARPTPGSKRAMADTLSDDWDDNPDWSDYEPRPLTDAERLIVARAKLGLTQQTMADLLGISVATLRNWEQKRTEPEGPGRALIRLLHAHPVEIRDWLEAA